MSPDKKLIFFSAYNGANNIYSCNADGSNVQPIIYGSAINDIQYFVCDTYYAKQQGKILFEKSYYYNDSQFNELWVANFDGSNAEKINILLPANVVYFYGELPKVSPDGKTIFFCASPAQDIYSYSLYSCNIDGSNVKTVVNGTQNAYFTIGGCYTINQVQKILYLEKLDSGTQMVIANLDGSNAQIININSQNITYLSGYPPKISSNGETIFFNANQGGVYSCNIDGSNLQGIKFGGSPIIYLGDTF
jgi:Tol biopolymer transport system component